MGLFSIGHALIVLLIALAVLYPIGRILRRLGFSPWWALLWIVPFVNVIALWVFAYRPWPRDPANS